MISKNEIFNNFNFAKLYNRKKCRFSAIDSLVVCSIESMAYFSKLVAAFFDMFAVEVVDQTWIAVIPINRRRSVVFAVNVKKQTFCLEKIHFCLDFEMFAMENQTYRMINPFISD